MIRINTAYVIPFSTTVAGVPTAADATPTAVLWRNGSAEVTSVVIVTTANTGIYHASFTTDAGWSATDRIWLVVSATIATVSYKAVAWDSFDEPDSAATITSSVWAFDLATAGANTAGAALAAVSTSFAKLFRWLGVLAGTGSDPATLAEINATTGGATFTNATRSLEAMGDAVGAAQVGDWSITRTFEVSGGDKVSGVRMSLVGVAGKTDTTGSSGIAIIKTDDGTYTLRVVVPAGYEDVADSSVTINGADSTATVTLVATTVEPPTNPLMSRLDVLCLDAAGEAEAGVEVDARIVSVPAGSTNTAFRGNKQTATSGVDGIATFEAPRGAKYQIKRGTAADWQTITIGSTDVTTISSFIGSP